MMFFFSHFHFFFRYHIAGTKGVFYAREPYTNNESVHVTRFLGLAAVGNKDKQVCFSRFMILVQIWIIDKCNKFFFTYFSLVQTLYLFFIASTFPCFAMNLYRTINFWLSYINEYVTRPTILYAPTHFIFILFIYDTFGYLLKRLVSKVLLLVNTSSG